LYPQIIKKNWTCLDIGAFEGVHSKVMAQIASEGKVFAFEPTPDNFNRLYSNVMGITNIIPIKMAVSNHIGETNLYFGKHNGCTEYNIRGKDLDENPTAIYCITQVTSIDKYFDLNEKIDFIKIDVEGAENLVLEGMRETLIKYRPIMIVEFHNDEGWEGAKVLESIDYKILNVYSNFSECVIGPIRGCYHGVAIPKESNILL
jgi:FkbM family methyltransferase